MKHFNANMASDIENVNKRSKPTPPTEGQVSLGDAMPDSSSYMDPGEDNQ